MTTPLPRESLAELLCVERRGDAAFTTRLESFWGAPLDADVWARAALAAASAQPDHTLFALHGRPPSALAPGVPLSLEVAAREEPKGIRRCEVTFSQNEPRGRVLAYTGERRSGPGYQDAVMPADLPDPDSLPSTLAQARAEGWPEAYARGPLEFRRAGPRFPDASRGESLRMRAWLRPRAPMPDAPTAVAAAALVFAIAFYSHWEFERHIGADFDYDRFEVLAQTFELQEVAPWRDWWLLDAGSESSNAGLARGSRRVFTRDGRLLAAGTSSALVASH